MSDGPSTQGLLTVIDDKDDACCDLTIKQRLIAGAVCAGIGVVFAIIAFILLFQGNTTSFAVLYTLSIALAVAASFFFVGPKKHIKSLKEVPAHVVSTCVLLAAMIFVFIGAFALDGGGRTAVVILAFIVEIVALIFFYITLYPLAWKAVKAVIEKVFSCG
jgi:hypothetical protein